MKLFRRNKDKSLGRGSEKTVSFSKIFDPLNYSPLPYEFTPRFQDYINSFEKDFEKRISKTTIDDLNFDMFDPSIESNVNLEIVRAKEQYTNHISVINHTLGLIRGAFETASHHLSNLEKEKIEVEKERSRYLQLKESLGIY